jgi:methylated-DNA-[protein]-cysteine S-methyltransferase
MDSPLGVITVTATGAGLRAVVMPGSRPMLPTVAAAGRGDSERAAEIVRRAVHQLTEYFAGRRWVFDLPLDLVGTDFQRAAWAELIRIPPGSTITYGEQAGRLGSPGAARAVGGANRANPVPIVVPCHRVVGAHGPGGYAHGEATKAWLLAHESAAAASSGIG